MKYIDENKLDGLYEAIRCCMCTNPMRSERGCDGCCYVDSKMYRNVCHVIDEFLTSAKIEAKPVQIEAEPVRHEPWIISNYYGGEERRSVITNRANPCQRKTWKIFPMRSMIISCGYKTLLEDYEIIEQKSDTVFVVKEKK